MQLIFLVKFKNLGRANDYIQCDKNEIEAK